MLIGSVAIFKLTYTEHHPARDADLTLGRAVMKIFPFYALLQGIVLAGIWLYPNNIEIGLIVAGILLSITMFWYEQNQHPKDGAVTAGDYFFIPTLFTTGIICLVYGVWGLFEQPPLWPGPAIVALFIIERFGWKMPLIHWSL
ncbi:MAG: hypothetical protein AAGA35_04030 [Patescibacteria group bacterium]